MGWSPIQEYSIIFFPALERSLLTQTVCREISTLPTPGRSHGASDFSSFPLPAIIPAAWKNQAVHAGSYPSIIGFALGIYTVPIDSGGVFSETGPLQSVSIFSSFIPSS